MRKRTMHKKSVPKIFDDFRDAFRMLQFFGMAGSDAAAIA